MKIKIVIKRWHQSSLFAGRRNLGGPASTTTIIITSTGALVRGGRGLGVVRGCKAREGGRGKMTTKTRADVNNNTVGGGL